MGDDTDDIVEDIKPTFGEMAADKLRNGMGSWGFIFWALAFLAAWILTAVNRLAPIDNPQLTILNLILSCIAALQGGILLISAKRQDQISSRLLVHASETIDDEEKDIKKLIRAFEAFTKAQNESV